MGLPELASWVSSVCDRPRPRVATTKKAAAGGDVLAQLTLQQGPGTADCHLPLQGRGLQLFQAALTQHQVSAPGRKPAYIAARPAHLCCLDLLLFHPVVPQRLACPSTGLQIARRPGHPINDKEGQINVFL